MAKGIAIKVEDDLLREIHVRAAERGLSTQQYITGLIERDLFPERFPQLTEEQMERLKAALEMVGQALGDVSDILRDHSEQDIGPPGMKLGG